MSKLVPVARFLTRELAEVARAALDEAGIEATVSADDAGGMIPLNNGVEVLVRDDQLAVARALIEPEDRADSAPEGETP